MLKSLTKKWKNLSFATQMNLAFIAIFIFPFLCLFFVQTFYTKEIIKNKIIDYMEANTRQASMNISSELNTYKNSAYQMILDNHFMNSALTLDKNAFPDYIYARQSVTNSFQTLASYYPNIQNMAFKTPKSKHILWYTRFDTNPDLFNTYNPMLESVKTSTSDSSKWTHTSYYVSWEKKELHMATLQHELKDFINDRLIGYYLLNISLDSFNDILTSARTSDAKNNTLMVADNHGNIFYSINDKALEKNTRDLINLNYSDFSQEQTLYHRKLVLTNEPILISVIPVNGTNWYLINLQKEAYIDKEVHFILLIMSCATVLLLLLTVFATSLISKSMSSSIKNIVTSMKTACNGTLTVQIQEKNKNEISIIGQQFNLMMMTISKQIQTIQKINEQTKEAEIRSLEAQIDPHFLYNTLDSINWIAIENDEPEISSMLCNLAEIMRYRIQNSNSLVSLDIELYYLEKYLELQKQRFSNCFDYIIDVNPELNNCILHKLLFQPFIENSLIHGFDRTEHGGILKIIVKKYNNDYLNFIIQDNGKGLSQEQVNDIFQIKNSSKSSIGIPNVLMRLELYYEKNYQFHVESEPNIGTTISIIIPQCYHKKIKEKEK